MRQKFIFFLLIFFIPVILISKNIGLPFKVNSNQNDKYDQQNPDVVSLYDKNLWFAVWEDWQDAVNGPDIYGAIIKANVDGDNITGAEVCKTFEITDSTDNNPSTNPSIAYDFDHKKLIIVWQSSLDIKYKILDVSSLDSSNCQDFAISTSAKILPGEDSLGFGFYSKGDIPNLPGTRVGRAKPKVIYNNYDKKFWLGWLEGRSERTKISFVYYDKKYDNNTKSYVRYPNYFDLYVGDNIFLNFASIVPDNRSPDNRSNDNISDNISPIKYIVTTHANQNDNSNARKIEFNEKEDSTYISTYIKYEFFTNISDFSLKKAINGIYLVFEAKRYELDFRNNLILGFAKWYKITPSNENPPTKQIYGDLSSKISAQGFILTLISNNNNNNYHPSVAFDSVTNRYLVAWEKEDDNGIPKIYAQLIEGLTGTKYFNNFKILSDEEENQWGELAKNIRQTNPAITFDPINQRFTITWQDNRNGLLSSENLDIYAQNIDTEGSLRGYNFLITTAEGDVSAKGNQYFAKLAYNKNLHAFLAIWKDARNLETTRSDIYAQIFTPGQPQIFIMKKDSDGNISPLIPLYYDFQGVNVGEEKYIYIVLKNTGDYNLKISDIYLTNDIDKNYRLENVEPILKDKNSQTYIELTPGVEFNFKVFFSPQQVGSYQNFIKIETDAGTKIITLQGIGQGASAEVEKKINFGDIPIGTDNVTKNLAIKNSNIINFSIVDLEILNNDTCSDPSYTYNSSKFLISNPDNYIGQIIESGKEIEIPITYLPDNDIGKFCAKVKIKLSFSEEPFYTELYVNSINRTVGVVVHPTDFNFETTVGESQTLSSKISNYFSDNITIKNINISGDKFTILNLNEGQKISPNSSYSFDIKFQSNNIGSYSGKAEIVFQVPLDNNSCTGSYKWVNSSCTYTVDLNFKGIASGQVKLSQENLSFGNVLIENTSNKWISIINNTGSNIKITNVSGPSYPFTVSNLQNDMLIPSGAKIPFLVSFTPPYEDNFTSSILIQLSNGQSLTLTIFGNGVAQEEMVKKVEINPTTIDFGSIHPGDYRIKVFSIKNKSDDFLIITKYNTLNAPFEILTDLQNMIIGPNDTVYVQLKFSSGELPEQEYNSKLTIEFSNGDKVDLSLKGKISSTVPTTEKISVNPSSISFGNVAVDTESKIWVTLTNPGEEVEITEIVGPFTPFFYNGELGKKIPENSKVGFSISFKPQFPNYFASTMSIKFSNGQVVNISLSGTGVSGVTSKFITIDNKSLDFGTVFPGSEKTLTVTITNNSNEYVSVKNVNSLEKPFELLTDIKNLVMMPNESVILEIRFAPENNFEGSVYTNLTIEFSNNEKLVIPLKGISKRFKKEISEEEMGITSTFPTSLDIDTSEGFAQLYFLKVSNKNKNLKIILTGKALKYDTLNKPEDSNSNISWLDQILNGNTTEKNTNQSYIYSFYLPQSLKNNVVGKDYKYFPCALSILSDNKRIYFRTFKFKVNSTNSLWKTYIPDLKIEINNKHAYFSPQTITTIKLNLSANVTVPNNTKPKLYIFITDQKYKNIWWVSSDGNYHSINNENILPYLISDVNFNYNKTLQIKWPRYATKGLYYLYWVLYDSTTETIFSDIAGVVIKDF